MNVLRLGDVSALVCKSWFYGSNLLLKEVVSKGYMVGGTTRDLFLGKIPLEIDIAIPYDYISFVSERLRGAGYKEILFSKKNFLIRFVKGKRQIDVVLYRGESDFKYREFNVSAIYLSFCGDNIILKDPTEGLFSLERGIILPTSFNAFKEDPIRSLRLLRIASCYGLKIGLKLRYLSELYCSDLFSVSLERIRQEFVEKIFLLNKSNYLYFVDLLNKTGLFSGLLGDIDLDFITKIEEAFFEEKEERFKRYLREVFSIKDTRAFIRALAILRTVFSWPSFLKEWNLFFKDSKGFNLFKRLWFIFRKEGVFDLKDENGFVFLYKYGECLPLMEFLVFGECREWTLDLSLNFIRYKLEFDILKLLRDLNVSCSDVSGLSSLLKIIKIGFLTKKFQSEKEVSMFLWRIKNFFGEDILRKEFYNDNAFFIIKSFFRVVD